MNLNAAYWQDKYQSGDTPWDIGYPSPPICNFVTKLSDKDISILIPGAGKAHEAAFLWQQGFRNITICDWASAAFEEVQRKIPDMPAENYRIGNFFDLNGQFDLILEQTFFCAIAPAQRADYAAKCFELLKPGGLLAGLLFNKVFEKPGPPFGGDAQTYQSIFSPYFTIHKMIPAEDSISPRYGNELFFVLEKPYMN